MQSFVCLNKSKEIMEHTIIDVKLYFKELVRGCIENKG
jgi:hypothetical protein